MLILTIWWCAATLLKTTLSNPRTRHSLICALSEQRVHKASAERGLNWTWSFDVCYNGRNLIRLGWHSFAQLRRRTASATAKCINFCELTHRKSEVLFESTRFPFGQTTGFLMLSRHSWQASTRFIMFRNCEHMRPRRLRYYPEEIHVRIYSLGPQLHCHVVCWMCVGQNDTH